MISLACLKRCSSQLVSETETKRKQAGLFLLSYLETKTYFFHITKVYFPAFYIASFIFDRSAGNPLLLGEQPYSVTRVAFVKLRNGGNR